MRRIVLMGCSGAGKSSLLKEVVRRGWATREEPGRRVVRAATARGGDGLPRRGAERFARPCIELWLDDLSRPARGPVLQDRCLIDAVSALRRIDYMTGDDVGLLAGDRYSYDPEEATREYEESHESIPAAGHAVETLPRRPIAGHGDRVDAKLREREPTR